MITSDCGFGKDLFDGARWLAQQPVDKNDRNSCVQSFPAELVSVTKGRSAPRPHWPGAQTSMGGIEFGIARETHLVAGHGAQAGQAMPADFVDQVLGRHRGEMDVPDGRGPVRRFQLIRNEPFRFAVIVSIMRGPRPDSWKPERAHRAGVTNQCGSRPGFPAIAGAWPALASWLIICSPLRVRLRDALGQHHRLAFRFRIGLEVADRFRHRARRAELPGDDRLERRVGVLHRRRHHVGGERGKRGDDGGRDRVDGLSPFGQRLTMPEVNMISPRRGAVKFPSELRPRVALLRRRAAD